MMKPIREIKSTPLGCHEKNPYLEIGGKMDSEVFPVPAMSRSMVRMKELGIDITKGEVPQEVLDFKPQLSIERYIEKYNEIHDYKDDQELRELCKNDENGYRQVFAKKNLLQDTSLIHSKHVYLIPVFDHTDIFKYHGEYEEEKNIPKVFPLEKHKQINDIIIVNKNEFEQNWRIFTEGLFSLLNWHNIFIAGGSILACLLCPPSKATKNFITLRKYYHEDVYPNSDIDLFIYGLNEEQGKAKLLEIYESIRNQIPFPVLCFRSAYAISIVSQYPYRHIQIILRLYSSPAEILMGFDVDSCAVGYDGKEVYMVPRCHQALVRQKNSIDMSRRSPTYEIRLSKYAERGFEVEVPLLDRERIDPMIFERPWGDVNGMARLLLLEKLRTPEDRYAYKERTANKRMSSTWKQQDLLEDPYVRNTLRFTGDKSSDYSTVFLPWGPQWTAKKIRKLMTTKDIVLNAGWSELFQSRGYHTHPAFIGTLEEVLKDCCQDCPPIPDVDSHGNPIDKESLECFVHGPLSFIVDDPGRQSIGSFHPITAGEWEEGAYLSNDSENISIAANKGDIQELIRYIEIEGNDINNTDFLGRTALHIAILSHQTEAVKYLLSHGANIKLLFNNGRNVFHVAAQYGYLDILELLTTYNNNLLKQENQSDSALDLNSICIETGLTALHYSILYGHLDCCNHLLNNHGDVTKMIWDQQKENGINILTLASHCECFNSEIAIDIGKSLVSHGASLTQIDTNLRNIFHYISVFNYPQYTKWLLSIPESKSLINDLTLKGESPLSLSILHGNYGITAVLLDSGASITISDASIDKANKLRLTFGLGNEWESPINKYNIEPLVFKLFHNLNKESSVILNKIIEKGYEINTIYEEKTVIDIIKNNSSFSNYDEYILKRIKENNEEENQLKYYYEKLNELSNDKNSYLYYVYKNIYINCRRKCCQKYDSDYSEEKHDYLQEIYSMICELGGKTARELNHMTEDDDQNKYIQKEIRDEVYEFHLFKESEYEWKKKAGIMEGDKLNYLQAYSAIWDGNEDVVHKLFTPNNRGECVFVLSCDPLGNTPLSIAAQRGHVTILCDLFHYLSLQYTPIKTEKTSNTNKISNYALIQALEHSDNRGEESSFVDPNVDMSMIINPLCVDIIFKTTSPYPLSLFPRGFGSIHQKQDRQYGYYYHNDNEGTQYISPYLDSHPIRQLMFEDKSYLSLNILNYIFFKYKNDDIHRIMNSILTVSKEIDIKRINNNIIKETDLNIITNNNLYNWFKNPSSNMEFQHNPFNYMKIFPLMSTIISDNIEGMKLLIKYIFGGLEVIRKDDLKNEKSFFRLYPLRKDIETDMVDKFHYESNTDYDQYFSDDDEYNHDYGNDIFSKNSSILDKDYLLNKSNKDNNNNNNEIIQEEINSIDDLSFDYSRGDSDHNYTDSDHNYTDSDHNYTDSDEEELKRLNAFRFTKPTGNSIHRHNFYHPFALCCFYNSKQCYDYILSEDIKIDIQYYIDHNKQIDVVKDILEMNSIDILLHNVFLPRFSDEYRYMVHMCIEGNSISLFRDVLEYCVHHGFKEEDIIYGNDRKISLIEVAGFVSSSETVSYLLEHYHFDNDSVYWLIRQNYEDITCCPHKYNLFKENIKLLIKYGYIECIQKIFLNCLSDGRIQVAKYILQQGITLNQIDLSEPIVDSETVINSIFEKQYKDCISMISNEYKNNPLFNTENTHGLTPIELLYKKIQSLLFVFKRGGLHNVNTNKWGTMNSISEREKVIYESNKIKQYKHQIETLINKEQTIDDEIEIETLKTMIIQEEHKNDLITRSMVSNRIQTDTRDIQEKHSFRSQSKKNACDYYSDGTPMKRYYKTSVIPSLNSIGYVTN
ncbi:hypothetical protein WA158_007877 [Blastocystis sp. Blastoise]